MNFHKFGRQLHKQHPGEEMGCCQHSGYSCLSRVTIPPKGNHCPNCGMTFKLINQVQSFSYLKLSISFQWLLSYKSNFKPFCISPLLSFSTYFPPLSFLCLYYPATDLPLNSQNIPSSFLASGPLHMLSILPGMLFLQVPSPLRLYLSCYHLSEVFPSHLTQTGLSHQLPSHHISCFLLCWLITACNILGCLLVTCLFHLNVCPSEGRDRVWLVHFHIFSLQPGR